MEDLVQDLAKSSRSAEQVLDALLVAIPCTSNTDVPAPEHDQFDYVDVFQIDAGLIKSLLACWGWVSVARMSTEAAPESTMTFAQSG